MRHSRITALVLIITACNETPLQPGPSPVTLRGATPIQVLTSRGDRPIAVARVDVYLHELARPLTLRTDSLGRAELPVSASSIQRIEVRALNHVPYRGLATGSVTLQHVEPAGETPVRPLRI